MILREGLVCEVIGDTLYLIGVAYGGYFSGRFKDVPKYRVKLNSDKVDVNSIIDKWSDDLTMLLTTCCSPDNDIRVHEVNGMMEPLDIDSYNDLVKSVVNLDDDNNGGYYGNNY